MSIQSVIIRCDHEGCNETADHLLAPVNWRQNTVSLVSGVRIVLDYCPAHEAEHAFALHLR